MYLVPDNQRNHYLKEISILAKILQSRNNFDTLHKATDLNTVRNILLDLVSDSKSIIGSDTRARMIQLETRTAPAPAQIQQLSNVIIEPVTIVAESNQKPVILAQNKELVDMLDESNQLIESISAKGSYEQNGWRVIKRDSSIYQSNRILFDCIAVKVILNDLSK